MSRGTKTRLDQAVEELKSYFGVLSKDDIFNVLIGSSEAKDIKKIYFDLIEGKPLPESGIASIIGLLQSQDTAYFAHEIIEKINEFNTKPPPGALEQLQKTLLVVYEDSESSISNGGDKIGCKTSLKSFTEPFKVGPQDKTLMEVNQDPQNPSKSKPALSAFVVGPNALNPSKRGTPSAQIFLNAIPTIEMSRCVPFLDVVLIPSTPALSDSGKVQSVSILQFLNGNFEPTGHDKDIANAVDLRVRKNILNTPPPKVFDEKKKRDDPSMTSAGMEIFTSPQTLVNGDESYGDGSVPSTRGAAIIDRFRPLMSLKDFKVDLVPSAGLLTFKTAQMSLVLHDRSRLSEIAEFVKPDLYGKTNMIVTYGWSHPDGNIDSNPYGRFLDSLKCTEKYGIVNSSFTFDQVGQVNISLKLSLKGSSQVELSKITEGTAVADALKDVKDLTEAVRAARSKKRGGKKGSKSVSGSKILSKMSDTGSAMGFDGDIKKEINEYIKAVRKAGSPGDLKKILPLLKKLRTAIPKARQNMASIVDAKIKGHKVKRKLTAKGSGGPTADPFAMSFSGKTSKYVNIRESDSSYTTFGSLVLAFAGAPLCGTGQFDEVQFVFYSFNDKASYMKNAPISSFPINFQTFTSKFKEACKTTTNMPIGVFIQFLTKNFVSSQTAEAYGLTNLYENDKENPGKIKLKKKFEDEKTGKDLLRSEKDLRLMDAYGIEDKEEDFGFKVPRIQMQAECLTGKEDGQSIYRIHIFDQNATSYSTLSQILQSAQSDALSSFTASVSKTSMKKGKDKSGNKEAMLKHLNSALQSGILEASPSTTKVEMSDIKGGTRFKVKTDFQKVKNFISSTMPSLVYGTSNTNITSANLASMNNPALTSMNMRRSGLGSGTSALGLRESGLPLQIAPTSLSMSSFGFPIATIGQTFFVDFGTGTSADNIYCCSKVTHEVSADKFVTNWTFQPLNAYGQYTNIGNSVNRAIAEIESD